jgi:origin recognition complex subunit 2
MSNITETPRKRRRATAFKGSYTELAGGPGNDPASDSDDSDVVMDDIDDGDEMLRTPSKRVSTPSRQMRHKGFHNNYDPDKSARKRATKQLLNRHLNDDQGDLDEEDALLAERIIEESNRTDESPRKLRIEDFREPEQGASMTGALFLDGSEGYFDQHKLREKISSTPFTLGSRLEYPEFVRYVKESQQIHQESRGYLSSLYRTMFPQWYFELTQGFSILFYGVGSKRVLLTEFVSESINKTLPVLVANGYNAATSFKEILNMAVSVLVSDQTVRQSMPKHPADLVAALVKYLEDADPGPQLVLLVHNLDGEALRSDNTQAMFARLVSVPQIWMIASVDHIQTPVLWDAAKLSQYNFLWHDLTTFELYTTETSFEDPLSLGKSRSAVGSKGVKYVLSSLTANARGLYRVLICHQIEVMTEELPPDDTSSIGTAQFGVDFKLLYKKCVEEFIVSNELNFRTMLGEFFEHKMAVSAKDQTGVERIYVPFTKVDIESILEDLTNM